MTTPLPSSGDTVAAAKQSLRLWIRSIRDAIRPDDASRAAEEAAARLLTLEESGRGSVAALYAPATSELDTGPLARGLRDRGVTLAYPRVLLGARRLRFHRVDREEDLVPGTFGIREPLRDAPVMPLERIDLLVLPGLAFSPSGTRLGWGKGHYDATLTRRQHLRGLLVGYGFECQVVDDLPRSAHDVPLDLIVTEKRVIDCRRGAPAG